MDQLQRDAGILPHLRPQLWRQPQAAHGRGPRQQQTPGDARHLGAQLQGAAAPNASGAGGWFAPGKWREIMGHLFERWKLLRKKRVFSREKGVFATLKSEELPS